ncbi:hypothetical protein F5884DRAFT_885346 [Xylogone sp. PMI_703]|nr:hypothetical protein F5884DRAFT_885346 [Xylogone sp. PMI_703]
MIFTSYSTTLLLAPLALLSTFGLADPFPPVYASEKCFMRIQVPQPGQTTNDARVTTLQWATTPQQVTNTIINFGGGPENAQLWRDGGMSTYLYAGFYQSSCINIIPQNSLNLPQNAISIILPSGVAKLQRVLPDPNQLSQADNRATSGIFGISGTLDPQDYAYTTGQTLINAIVGWKKQFSDPRTGQVQDGQVQFHAVRADGTGVVITTELLA